MQKRKGFTLVELVIVIAVIAILAGVLIGTFASVINRANESARVQQVKAQEIEQKADDILKKIEDSNWYGWEDFETSIVAKLTAAYKANGGTALTEEEVKEAVTAAMEEFSKEHTSQNTSLTEEQVKAIVENALGTLKYEGVSEAQVRAIINEATSNVLKSQLNLSQIKSVVTAANANNLTAAQLSKELAEKLAGVVTVTDLETKLSAAVTTLTNTLEATVLSEEQVAKLIEDLVPVTISVATKTEFESKAKSLNSGSTIVWTGASDVTLDVDLEDDVKTLTIRGDIKTLNIDAAKATIYVLGNVETLNVDKVANDSLHIYGQVKDAFVKSGRLVLEAGAKVTGTLTAKPAVNATVTIEIEKNSNVEKLVAEYQRNGTGTSDKIEITNNGTVGTAELTAVDSAWKPQGSEGANNTTNVRVVNGEGAEGTSVSTNPEENDITPYAGTQITVVENTGSSTYTSQEQSYVVTSDPELTSFWGELYATSFAGGKGTAVDPYKISNAAELTRLSYLMLEDPDNYKRKYYVLTNDIDLSESTWMPISSYNRNASETVGKWFEGTFDGQGYTIDGMNDKNVAKLLYDKFTAKNKSTVQGSAGEYSFGLFGSVKKATIKNINLTNVDISGKTFNDPNDNTKVYVADSVGALAGFSLGSITIDNISVTGTVKGNDSVAGVIGRLYNKSNDTIYENNNVISITNCTNNASVTGENHATSHGYARVGGVFAYLGGNNYTATIENNTNNGAVTSISNNAGIYVAGVGNILSDNKLTTCSITNNTNTGNITITNDMDAPYNEHISSVVHIENSNNYITASGNTNTGAVTLQGVSYNAKNVSMTSNNTEVQVSN